MTELPAGAELFGIAQYIPASAKAASISSTVLLMGDSPGEGFAPGGSIRPEWPLCPSILWITTKFRTASRHEGTAKYQGLWKRWVFGVAYCGMRRIAVNYSINQFRFSACRQAVLPPMVWHPSGICLQAAKILAGSDTAGSLLRTPGPLTHLG
jgi:hypothetical protein